MISDEEKIMENLFRLVLTRPAIVQDEDAPSISLAQNSPFQAALGDAQQNENPRDALKAVAREFIASDGFVGGPQSLAIYDQLKALGVALAALERKKTVTNAELSKAIEEAFGKKPAELVKSNVLDAPVAALKDSLIAIKLLPEEHRRSIESLTNQLRDLEVILKTVASKDFPKDGATLRRYRRRSVMLPSEIELRSTLSTLEQQKELERQRKEAEAKKRQEAEAKLDRYKRLNAAIEELTNISSDHLQSTPQKADAGFLVPATYRPTQLLIQDLTQRQQVSQLNLLRLQAAVGKGENVELIASASAEAPTAESSSRQPLSLLFVAGKGPFTPLAQGETAFRLKSSAEETLSRSTLETLKERGLSVSENPLDTIAEKLRAEVMQLSSELDELLGRPVQRTFKRLGNAMVMVSTPMASVWNSMVIAGNLNIDSIPFPLDARVPDSHGNIAPAGIADLLVVKQQLVGYEAADVAHIENVLKARAYAAPRDRRDHLP
jgi:hypothetical protein